MMYVLGGLILTILVEILFIAFTQKVPEEKKIFIKIGLGCLIIGLALIAFGIFY